LKLGARIIENDWEWEFIINCKNIREFQPYIKMKREEIEQLKIESNRDENLSSILED
jgi:hypothetical protein